MAKSHPQQPRRTWIDGDRLLARSVARPVRSFLAIEAAGGLLLIAAALVALVWANSPWHRAYETLWHTDVELALGRYRFGQSLGHFVNDGLMAVFFFVIGLEIKREWVAGELRDRRAAVLPVIAALGGMVVPALMYLAIDAGSPTSHGWGIPMATDIAFALGAVALLGRRVPTPLKVFLLTLAIVDDLGAIVVIAVFYAGELRWVWLTVAGIGLLVIVGMRAVHVRWLPVYVAVGLFVWFATLQSGVHATIAGVALGLLTPMAAGFEGESASPLDRLEMALHPWSSFVIVPVFALANAGVRFGSAVGGTGTTVTIGVIVGLVLGKTVGVAGASWVAVRLGWAPKPDGVTWAQFVGVAVLAGIGFTMSLFITDLAFSGRASAAAYVDHAKVGVLAASVLAAAIGSAILVASSGARSGSARRPGKHRFLR